jgi:beta-RFAP synthase
MSGGFVVDGGRQLSSGEASSLPPATIRLPFPEEWRFVVAVPGLRQGLSGESEELAFMQLPRPSAEHVGRVCRLLVMKLLPSLVERDVKSFGAALTGIQHLVGEMFESVQGGVFAGGRVEDLVNLMLREGAYGAGQSSWGPTVYGLVRGGLEASMLNRRVKEFIADKGGGAVYVTGASNRGALVRVGRGTED